ncbi:hypothetical protein NPIL_397041 [Nephila pilipes]|uniref:Uncharacterized protein n=1 Tax=Nephila pilipes TaxID=299642 RepID=A0A8X6MSW3_NEPPI|nr:hypothetical protein NPIL_397041 [Nephila pilipes]
MAFFNIGNDIDLSSYAFDLKDRQSKRVNSSDLSCLETFRVVYFIREETDEVERTASSTIWKALLMLKAGLLLG